MVYYLLSNKLVWRSNKNLLDATEKKTLKWKQNIFPDKTASCYKTTTRKTQRIMSRTERRGGDICSHYLNSFVGVNCPDRDIAAHLHQYTLTRHPETRRAASDTCLCLALLWKAGVLSSPLERSTQRCPRQKGKSRNIRRKYRWCSM